MIRVFSPFVVVALLLSGCVRVQQDLVLESDGSGSLAILYGVNDQDLQRMRQVARSMAALDPDLTQQDVDWLTAFDEATIRREWSKFHAEGVDLHNVKTYVEGGWRFMKANIRFRSLQQLLDCGMIEHCHIALAKAPGGYYGYQQSIDVKNATKSLPSGMDMASLQPVFNMMMKDFDVVFRVTAPSRIIKSNADKIEGTTATWAFHAGQTDLMQRLQTLDLRLMFEGRGVEIADARMGK